MMGLEAGVGACWEPVLRHREALRTGGCLRI